MTPQIAGAAYRPYGAPELKATYQRNMAIGNLAVMGLVTSILVVTTMLSGTVETVETTIVPDTVSIELVKPPTVVIDPPEFDPSGPAVAATGEIGIPKPVADSMLIDDDVTIATREELAQIIDANTGPGIGTGNVVVDFDSVTDFIPEYGVFQPVEKRPVLIYKHPPEYPRMARLAGLSGVVVVKVLVDEEGKVIDAGVVNSSGVTAFDDAAVEAAYHNKFTPGIQNKRPTKVWVTYEAEFILIK